MIKTITATWILESTRPDLVANWFTGHAYQVSQFLVKAQQLAYGGVDEEDSISKIVDELERLHQLAAYERFLVQHATDENAVLFETSEFRLCKVTIEESKKSIDADINEITRLRAFVNKLGACVDKFSRG